MIKIVSPFGYCSGVNMAIDEAKRIKSKYSDRNVVMLGRLVHNNDALRELESFGVKTIYEDGKTYEELLPLVKDDDIVILTAHGHTKEVEETLKNRKITYFDTTCPFVKMAHKQIIDAIMEGHEVIYIGKKNHPEAISCLSLSDKVYLYDIRFGLDLDLIKDPKPYIYSQTTFSSLDVASIIKKIKDLIPGAVEGKTICHSSTTRQEALLSLDEDTDLIYILGSDYSNNSRVLFDLAQERYENADVYLIENEDFVTKEQVLGKKKIAIATGASTPKEIAIKVQDKIEDLLNK